MNREVPPHDRDAEASVLGSMIINGETIAAIIEIIKIADFYIAAHREIFQGIQRLHAADEPVDLISLKNELSRAGVLERIGGAEVVVAVAESVPTSANATHYAKIVRDKAVQRRLISEATTIARDARSTEDVDQLVRLSQQRLAGIGAAPSRNAIELPDADGLTSVRKLAREFDVEGRGERQTLSFPWPRLTDATRALRPGAISIIAGGPGIGKSFLALETAVFLHGQGEAFTYLPLEDTKTDFLRRVLAHIAARRIRSSNSILPHQHP